MQAGMLAAKGTRVICPGCGTRYAITSEFYGRTVLCEQCQQDLIVPEYKERVDARPILRRGEGVIWAKIESERDRIYEALRAACESQELEAHVLHSGPYDYPAQVSFECWLPRGDPLVTERSSALITINPAPFCRFDVVYDVVLRRSQGLGETTGSRRVRFRWWFWLLCILFPVLLLAPLGYLGWRFFASGGGKTKWFTNLRELPPDELERVVIYLQHRGWCPYLTKYAVRRYWWQLWRPKNKIEALMPDWLAILNTSLAALGFGVFALGYTLPRYQKYWPVAGALWIGALGLGVYLKLRPKLVRSSGKPEREPRDLRPGDCWHVVLFDLGPQTQDFKGRCEAALRNAAQAKMRFRSETIWYRGLDDIEEREQMVLELGRAQVYCQIYQYQNDLYVGWDAYLNQAQWKEISTAKGLDRECGLPVTIAVTVPGAQQVTEYDLADLHLVTEWVHAAICKHVRHLVREQGIDQEIDFRPVHNERQTLRESSGLNNGRPHGGVVHSLFHRRA